MAVDPHTVTLVVSELAYGGAEIQVRDLAVSLARRGWRTNLVVLHAPEAFVNDLEASGVVVHSLNLRQPVPPLLVYSNLVACLRKQKPDVVHSHMRGANLLTRAARLFVHFPVLICTAHNMNENVSDKGFGARTELWYRLTDRLCDLTTNVSWESTQHYITARAAPSPRIRYVPNGIDVKRFRRDPYARMKIRNALGLAEQPVAIAIGRFVPQKKHAMLLRSFAAALANSPDARLLLLGDGPSLEPARQHAEQLGVRDSLHFLGVRDDVVDFLSAADCIALSSDYEGLPLVLLEAAACELPAVATAVGGVPEIVEDAVSGFLSSPGDEAAFTQNLVAMFGLGARDRETMGYNARMKVESTYALDAVIDTWERTYHEFLQRKFPRVTRA